MPYDALEGLDSRQKDAASCLDNSVVAAGAGSGKTRVLAARYAWLVTQKHIPVDHIVTLTFTQKAVTEMYSRIYAELCRAAPHSEAARIAVENFHTARIATLDSYCASIAKNAARHFGLSPDFTVDIHTVRDHIREQALPFILRNRHKTAIRLLLGEHGIEDIIESLFVTTFIRYSTLSRPIQFAAVFESQKKEIQKRWKHLAVTLAQSLEAARAEFESITEAAAQKTVVYATLTDFFKTYSTPLSVPDCAEQIPDFLTYIYDFTCIAYSGRTTNNALALIKSIRDEAKTQYKLCASTANYILHENNITELFAVLAEFQESVNRQKRLSGCLTFNDVSQLALDALIQLSEIRQTEKNSIRAIMIDEFQDNNEAQRNLLFLLAEKPELCTKEIPVGQELCPDKLFFVGDEKQSIYKFRGADVAVFRKLKNDLGNRARIKNLSLNYRSHPDLLSFFNTFFSSIFLCGDIPEYEAEYTNVEPCPSLESEAGGKPRVHFFIYNGTSDEDDETIADTEREAAFTARKIKELYQNGYPVFKNEKGSAQNRPCEYGDFAILFRSYGRQHLFEKQLRQCAIPYTCENIAGFFNDAPVNDLYNILRLIVYPLDTNAYGSVLRSPFAGLSRSSMLACLAALQENETPQDTQSSTVYFDESRRTIFCKEAEVYLTEEEKKRYHSCRTLYEHLIVLQNRMSTAELTTFLWYEAGYRFETLWNDSVQLYAELYDYFFELARQADAEGLPLIGFIDRIAHIKANGERIEDTDIPSTRSGGVRLMSIHKSKGLEFPLVFVGEIGSQGRNVQNTDLCYFDTQHGFSVNLPRHALIPFEKDANCGNYFFNIQKELEENKNAAELRRLLYVALTRAESAVFVTGKYKLDTTKLDPDTTLYDAMCHLAQSGNKTRSFLDLLLPVFAATPPSARNNLYTLQDLPPYANYSIHERQPQKETAFTRAKPLYETAQLFVLKKPSEYHITPSTLSVPQTFKKHRIKAEDDFDEYAAKQNTLASTLPDITCIEQIVEETQGTFTQADFGTIAHAHVETLFTHTPPRISSRILANLNQTQYERLNTLAIQMATLFATSDIGILAKKAHWAKTEFAFKSRINHHSLPNGFAILAGQMDLIFESENELYIVDFKSGIVEDENRHLAQLASYKHAAHQIFGKHTHCILYYLRDGNTVDVTAAAANVNIQDTMYTPCTQNTQ